MHTGSHAAKIRVGMTLVILLLRSPVPRHTGVPGGRLDEPTAAVGLADNTLIVLNADHGETPYQHECCFDHHGMCDNTLHVPLIMRLPGKLPEGARVPGHTLHRDLVPTVLGLLSIHPDIRFDGTSLLPLVRGTKASNWSDFYITECTWMRKHGWRTPHRKPMVALAPDFHFTPAIELYNLVEDPLELRNLASKEPGMVAALRERMEKWIAKRERETGRTNPMYTNLQWHGTSHDGAFETSQQAYDTLHIGSAGAANRLQAGKKAGRRKAGSKSQKR